MSRYEILSPEGLRVDGRRWNEIRRFHAQLSTQPAAADGSSYVEQGNTKVVCTVTGPAEASMRSKQLHDKTSVTVEVTFAAFSGTERKRRGKNDKRVQEMRTMLQRTFASAILTHLHPRSEITISLHILSQDGGVLATCVNAITLALIDAGVPMTDYVVGMTAGITTSTSSEDKTEGEPLLDVNGIEDSDLPTLTVATLGATENISLLQLENKVHMTLVESMLAAAIDGCAKMKEMLDEVVRKHGEEVARSGAL
ncbi:ribosomal protein S5 domain 2-like protein [Wilcoxina mikolae CBS 423.85]|nr:ribosomal protein S5 domain 2-like protein [Wilcoxina mikolae CBS 423.85]